MNTPQTDRAPLSAVDLERLEAGLAALTSPTALSLEGMDGLFAALLASLEIEPANRYLPIVWGTDGAAPPVFKSRQDAETLLLQVMRHWHAVRQDYERDGVHVPLVFEVPAGEVPGRAWARGFMRGVEAAPTGWSDLFGDEQEGQLVAIPLVAGLIDPHWPKAPLSRAQSDELLALMAAGSGRAYRRLKALREAQAETPAPSGPVLIPDVTPVRRSTPKLGRNDRCACGSGAKVKHCCGRAGRI